MFSQLFSIPLIKPQKINIFELLIGLCSIPVQILSNESAIILFVVKVGSQLVQPMLAMITELQRRHAELCILLRKKDQEILDYKDSGVRLSRSTVHATWFFFYINENVVMIVQNTSSTNFCFPRVPKLPVNKLKKMSPSCPQDNVCHLLACM